MSTSSTKLNPVIVTEETIGDAAFDGQRRRPVVALNEKGELVVCCRRTARKHGWTLEGVLFQRRHNGKIVAPKPAAPARRATDKDDVLVVSAPAASKLVDEVLEILGGKK